MKLSSVLNRNRNRNANEIVKVAFGDVGNGIYRVQGTGEFARRELKQMKLHFNPYSFARPDIRPLEKNALLGIRRYRLVRDNLKGFLETELMGKKVGTFDFGTGGGTGTVAVLAIEPALEFVQYLVARAYIDEHTFIDFGEEGERKYINTTIQLMLLREKLKENSQVAVELIDMTTACLDHRLSYEELDRQVLDIDTILGCTSQQSVGFDLEDMLTDPAFRVRTYGTRSFSILNSPDILGSRILDEIKRLRPLFNPNLFKDEPSDRAIVGLPIIIICGPDGVVQETGQFLNRGTVFHGRMSLKERDHQEVSNRNGFSSLYRKVVAYPLPSSQKVYIVGIYPVDSEWWLNVLADRKKQFLELLRAVRNGDNPSLRMVVLKNMIAQAGYSSLDELLWEEGI